MNLAQSTRIAKCRKRNHFSCLQSPLLSQAKNILYIVSSITEYYIRIRIQRGGGGICTLRGIVKNQCFPLIFRKGCRCPANTHMFNIFRC